MIMQIIVGVFLEMEQVSLEVFFVVLGSGLRHQLRLRNPLQALDGLDLSIPFTNKAVLRRKYLSRDLNLGLLGEKRERNLCAMPPP